MRVIISILLSSLVILISMPAAADWPMLQNGPAHTGYTAEPGPLTDNLLWQWNPEGPFGSEYFRSMPPVVGGRVYSVINPYRSDYLTVDGQVVCLDAYTGAEVWRYHRWGNRMIEKHPAVSGGRIYFACTTRPGIPYYGSSDLNCHDAETGIGVWTANVNGRADSLVVDDGIAFTTSTVQYSYYYGTYYYYLSAYDAEEGTLLWGIYHSNDDGHAFSHPCVHLGRVYSGWADGNLICLDALNGATVWERALEPANIAAPTFSEGRIYYFVTGVGLMALDPENGETIWSRPGLFSAASIAAAGGQLFVVQSDGSVTALDSATGTVNWSRITHDGSLYMEPVVAGDKLYFASRDVASTDVILRCLDCATGDSIWSADTGAYGLSSPAVSNGNLYLTNRIGDLYCYGTQSIMAAGLTCSPPPGQQSIDTTVEMSLTNLLADEPRQFFYRINLTEPDGSFNTPWRQGWQNVMAGETWSTSWTHNIPGLEGNWGTVLFELEAQDVTPAPWNQPPYAPSGFVVNDACSAEIGVVDAALTCEPSSGTLPFDSQFEVSLTNTYTGLTRRLFYDITVTLANGQHFPHWRQGWQNVGAGQTFNKNWWQTIPGYVSLIGTNQFDLFVLDVTPPPYNLPPYPPAGDTDVDQCTINASEAP